MIGLDTNILARYYIDDAADAKTLRQRQSARKLLESGHPLKISKTVILELEWVLRGHYRFSRQEVIRVFMHLLKLPHATVECREEVELAVAGMRDGLDFADALHHAAYRDCEVMASFDHRTLARKASKLNLAPRIKIPTT